MDDVEHHSWAAGPDTAGCESWVSPIPRRCSLEGNEASGFNQMVVFIGKLDEFPKVHCWILMFIITSSQ